MTTGNDFYLVFLQVLMMSVMFLSVLSLLLGGMVYI